MSLWRIAWSYLWDRKFPTILTILSVALGVGLISAVLTLRQETQRRFEEEGQAYDMVVGATQGSPLQLVVSTVYFIDRPIGNIPYSVYERLLEEGDVKAAFPISLGDTYKGFRIVGTIPGLFDHTWVHPYTKEVRDPFQFAEGDRFTKPFEAVIGSQVAREQNLRIGSEFIGTHGFVQDHSDHPFTVVGILKPSGTPNDRALFVDLASVWELHPHEDEEPASEAAPASPAPAGPVPPGATHPGHEAGHDHEDHREITAVLINLHTPATRFSFYEHVKSEYQAMPAIPVNEIKTLYQNLLGTAKLVLLSVGYLVVVVSAITIMIGLYLSILQRRRDLAIMRALGASTMDIFGAVIIEAFLVTILGIASGWLLGNTVSWGLGQYLGARYGLTITAFGISHEEITAFAAVAFVGYLAGVLPAFQAYRTDVARDLSR